MINLKPMIYLLCAATCRCFVPFLQNFKYLLEKNGHEAKIVHQYNPAQDDGLDLWIVIWNSVPILPRKCIIYNMDPMVPHFERQIKTLIQNSPDSNILKIVDYCYGLNQPKLTELNIPLSVMVYGYSPYHKYLRDLATSYIDGPISQPIDILFYGNVSKRRIPIIVELNKLADRKNYNFMVRNYDLSMKQKK
jgi:hypothetical protein